MSIQLSDLIQNNAIFKHLTDPEQAELIRLANRKALKRGESLFYQGDDWRGVLMIASGTLRSIIYAPDGRIYSVSTWEAGADFWAHTLFDHEGMPSTLEAVKSSVVYQWPGEETFNLVLGNRAATRALLRRQTEMIRKRRQNIYELAFNPVASRLAKLVIDKFENAESPTVQRDLTLEEMAAMIASSPEVICRTLYQFQNEGIIEVNRASITLHNREALLNLMSEE
ncbi:MAG: Crp/Fnr family transcriptional regulator [Anaerolineales bacterium]|nr:Crp/Fnr family transcriptional regulator [Anaerolineales bacterium]